MASKDPKERLDRVTMVHSGLHDMMRGIEDFLDRFGDPESTMATKGSFQSSVAYLGRAQASQDPKKNLNGIRDLLKISFSGLIIAQFMERTGTTIESIPRAAIAGGKKGRGKDRTLCDSLISDPPDDIKDPATLTAYVKEKCDEIATAMLANFDKDNVAADLHHLPSIAEAVRTNPLYGGPGSHLEWACTGCGRTDRNQKSLYKHFVTECLGTTGIACSPEAHRAYNQHITAKRTNGKSVVHGTAPTIAEYHSAWATHLAFEALFEECNNTGNGTLMYILMKHRLVFYAAGCDRKQGQRPTNYRLLTLRGLLNDFTIAPSNQQYIRHAAFVNMTGGPSSVRPADAVCEEHVRTIKDRVRVGGGCNVGCVCAYTHAVSHNVRSLK